MSATWNNRGIAEVTIDGVVYSADMYSSSLIYKAEVLKVTGLNSGTHTITIKDVGIKSKNSKGYILDIDGFRIYNGNIV